MGQSINIGFFFFLIPPKSLISTRLHREMINKYFHIYHTLRGMATMSREIFPDKKTFPPFLLRDILLKDRIWFLWDQILSFKGSPLILKGTFFLSAKIVYDLFNSFIKRNTRKK